MDFFVSFLHIAEEIPNQCLIDFKQ